MDEMANAEMHSMLTIHSEKHLSVLRVFDQGPASCKIFTRR